jgi:uncharacterized protein YrrD
MLRSANDLIDFSIGATDGDIGRVEEFYFDEERWTVRYIVVNTGGWFNERKVPISPLSVERTDLIFRHIETPLTREEVKASPRLETARKISRRQETAYNQYYRFPDYWDGPKLWGVAESPKEINLHHGRAQKTGPSERDSSERHLRGTRQVVGYGIAARDGTIGHVDDLIVDDETWTIRYFVIDTRNWWPGKKVLLSPRWITRVGWQEKKVSVDLPRQEIKNSPEYNDTAPIERDYEERLHEYYGENGYWQPAQNNQEGGKQYGTGSR